MPETYMLKINGVYCAAALFIWLPCKNCFRLAGMLFLCMKIPTDKSYGNYQHQWLYV